ncbi:MAG: hypothetical protein E3J72_01195 [Planctomycetota bacterium]|nr:MAG: hypothetical protein E3J72_01195 [Planctomycetota bacterium]
MKKLCLLLLGLIIVTFSGCITTNWHHNRRHFVQIREQIRYMHKEFDRIFMDLEPDPTER